MNSIEAQKQLTDRELIIFNSELDRKRKSTAIADALLSIMMLIDLFTISGQIKKREDRVRKDLLTRLVSSKA